MRVASFCAPSFAGLAFGLLVSVSLPASAQMATDRLTMSRIDRLEQKLGEMERDGGAAYDPGNAPASGTGSAVLGNRIAGLEEQMRMLQGKIEEANYKNLQLEQQLKTQQQDMDFRLRELEQKATPAAAPAAQPAAAAANEAPAAAPAASAANPNDQYNQAFRLLNQSKYDESYAAFKQFVTQHPKDPLVGNAFYWMGETFYVRRDYVQAADHFRQGFENGPKGPKAGDNLLKLAMSLSALNRNSEACTVLRQVAKEYAAKSAAVVGKANNEMARIGCK